MRVEHVEIRVLGNENTMFSCFHVPQNDHYLSCTWIRWLLVGFMDHISFRPCDWFTSFLGLFPLVTRDARCHWYFGQCILLEVWAQGLCRPNKTRDFQKLGDLQDPKNPAHSIIMQVSANVLFLGRGVSMFQGFRLHPPQLLVLNGLTSQLWGTPYIPLLDS